MPAIRAAMTVPRAVVAASLGTLLVLFVIHVVFGNYRSEEDNFAAYHGNDLTLHPERTHITGLENIFFVDADGDRISGWYVASRNHAAVILVHGTNADRTSLLVEIRLLANAGFGVLAFDLPGQGSSEGRVLWGKGERHALAAAVDWIATRSDVDPQRIGGFGFSMGGYTLIQVAAEDPRLHTLVLAATPTDMLELAMWEHRRWGWLSRLPAELALYISGMPRDGKSPRNLIAKLAPRPILILAGDADPTVPPAMTRALYFAANAPKTLWMVNGAHHGHYAEVAPDEYPSRLIGFFQQGLINPPQP